MPVSIRNVTKRLKRKRPCQGVQPTGVAGPTCPPPKSSPTPRYDPTTAKSLPTSKPPNSIQSTLYAATETKVKISLAISEKKPTIALVQANEVSEALYTLLLFKRTMRESEATRASERINRASFKSHTHSLSQLQKRHSIESFQKNITTVQRFTIL